MNIHNETDSEVIKTQIIEQEKTVRFKMELKHSTERHVVFVLVLIFLVIVMLFVSYMKFYSK